MNSYTPEEFGLNLSCNNGGTSTNPCTFLGGQSGCGLLSGTPLIAGDFSITIDANVYVTASLGGFDIPLEFPFNYEGYTLSVGTGGELGCTDLIISEVVEGFSNNHAIEIYNPTATAIDASEYGLVRFQNGSTTPGNITYLTGVSIAPYDVYVVVLDKRDPDGTSFEAPVWDELQLQADVFVNPSYNDGQEVMYFNGNDAIAIVKDSGQTLVDVFGKIGDMNALLKIEAAEGEQAYISQDHTLVRKASFTQGYTANPESFDIS